MRLALWSGEEQGLYGSRAYVKQHFADPVTMALRPEHAKVSAYFNLDNGTGKIRGVYLQDNDMARPLFEAWLAPFKDEGADTITLHNTGGTDHLSFDAVGLPGFQFIQDPLDYGSRHPPLEPRRVRARPGRRPDAGRGDHRDLGLRGGQPARCLPAQAAACAAPSEGRAAGVTARDVEHFLHRVLAPTASSRQHGHGLLTSGACRVQFLLLPPTRERDVVELGVGSSLPARARVHFLLLLPTCERDVVELGMGSSLPARARVHFLLLLPTRHHRLDDGGHQRLTPAARRVHFLLLLPTRHHHLVAAGHELPIGPPDHEKPHRHGLRQTTHAIAPITSTSAPYTDCSGASTRHPTAIPASTSKKKSTT